jgi:hypothetical protein
VDYTLQFDPEYRVLLITLGEIVTAPTAHAAYAAVERFSNAMGGCAIIADLSAIQLVEISGSTVRSLAWMPHHRDRSNLLIIVAPQPVIYGLSRMFQMWRDEQAGYQVVSTLDEAYALVSVRAPRFQAVDPDSAMLIARAGCSANTIGLAS